MRLNNNIVYARLDKIIYDAAVCQNKVALDNALSLSDKDDLWYFEPLARLLKENNQIACEFLLAAGANITYAAVRAALHGNETYADALIARGAAINEVASCAMMVGNIIYVEKLLAKGACINVAAKNAVLYGHTAYADALLTRGADITEVACGAARCGNNEYTDRLLQRGADIKKVVREIVEKGNVRYLNILVSRGVEIPGIHDLVKLAEENRLKRLRSLSQSEAKNQDSGYETDPDEKNDKGEDNLELETRIFFDSRKIKLPAGKLWRKSSDVEAGKRIYVGTGAPGQGLLVYRFFKQIINRGPDDVTQVTNETTGKTDLIIYLATRKRAKM